MRSLKGKRVVVMGLGVFGGGVGAVRFLCREGARVTVTDLRPASDLRASLEKLDGCSITLKLGGHDTADFQSADLIVANPGVPRSSAFLKLAEAAGIPISTEICLFVERCPAPVVGVTGSSGKTTTTSLLFEMVRRHHPGTFVGGNIGASLLGQLDHMKKETPVILELSSFQLDYLGDLPWSPKVAVVTNFAPNHLDVHGSLDAYRRAKYQIVAHQGEDGVAVVNADDAEVNGWVIQGDARRFAFGLCTKSVPGIFLDANEICYQDTGPVQTLCGAEEIRLTGRHNLANALAASGAALRMGVCPQKIVEAVREFSGVAHRLERVAEVDGITYYNDSIATSPDRTRVALEAFSGRVVLIAGGSDKGLAFDRLGPVIAEKVCDLILMGKTGDAIAGAVPRDGRVVFHRAETLEDAVCVAKSVAQNGDVVLLSPASASYDMFRNFEERGERFKQLVCERL
ncbi:MAG: UDP-N-acetylmuramoyl-L-alanine--D-glutamate ligase [bacterium]|nr:UDP-N-acetylmuramoyl-L-alanine--D-glutamate ligase [bacterium]